VLIVRADTRLNMACGRLMHSIPSQCRKIIELSDNQRVNYVHVYSQRKQYFDETFLCDPVILFSYIVIIIAKTGA